MLWQEPDAANSFQKGRVDFGSGQADGEIVDFLDRKFLSIDGEIKGRTIWEAWVVDRLKGEDHIISGKGVAIGPANTFAEVKGEGFVVRGDSQRVARPGSTSWVTGSLVKASQINTPTHPLDAAASESGG